MRAWRTRPVPVDRRRHELAGTPGTARPRIGAVSGSRAPAGCACTRSSSIPCAPTGCTSRSRRPGRFGPTMAARPGSRSTRACIRRASLTRTAEVGHCVHRIAMHPSRPDVLFMQKHWDVMRSDDAGDSWREVSGNLPTDFGFPIDVHAHEPDTIYVVPITSDSEHYPPEGKLRVYRSRTGGNEWEPLTSGLPQSDCYVNVLRDAMAVDSLDECGVYFGTTGGQVYASADAGRHRGRRSSATCRRCCRSRCRRCHDPRSRWCSPVTCGNWPSIDGAVELEVAGQVTQRSVLDAWRPAIRRCGARSATRDAASAGRSCGSLPARKICPMSTRMIRCPRRSRLVPSRTW